MLREAGITITEVKIGFDGIVLGNSKAGPSAVNLTKKQIFLALAKEVPDGKGKHGRPTPTPALEPDRPGSARHVKIEVLGPPPTSGTRDAFVELAMEGGAKELRRAWRRCARPTRRPSRPSPTRCVKTVPSSRPARTTT